MAVHRFSLILGACLTVVCLLYMGAAAAQPTAPSVRLFVEAEDFQPIMGDWKPMDYGTNYYASTFAITFLSRGRYLGAPEQGLPSRAEKEIDIPRDGTYELWARYEQPYDYAVEFDIEVQQEGKTLLQRGYGRRDAPKLWPFKKGFQAQVLWEWGGGDNIVWEGRGARVDLKKGKAKLILSKNRQDTVQAGRRNVDVVVLTDDLAGIEKQIKEAGYLPLDGWLTQAGDVLLSASNPPDAAGPVALRLSPCTEHSPYWVHVRDWPSELWVGQEISEKPLKPDLLLKPGASAPPVEVGRFFDTLNQFQWTVKVVGPDGKPAANRKVHLRFTGRGTGGQAQEYRADTFTTAADGTIAFFLDGDIRRTRRIRTVEEDLEGVARLVASFPNRGRRPEKFLIYGIMGFSGALDHAGRIGELSREIALSLGSNTLPLVSEPVKNGYIDVRSVATKDLVAYCQKLKQSGQAERIKVVSLGDEIHIGGAAKSPEDDAAFRTFLKSRKHITPADVGLASFDEARLELKNKESRLYYYSEVFSFEKALLQIRERTDILEAQLGKDITVGANYSPHPYYWPKEGQWVRAFQRRAMTLPWGEDYTWQIPEASPQIVGYLLDALRCGALEHNLPIHWYVMPHYPGTTPDNLRRAYYAAIGHGAKQLNFFCATPLSVGYTENWVSGDAKETWRTIKELVEETGMFEHVAFDAKVRPAEVALLISFAQDLWETDPAYNHERKCLYYALRQSGYAVDFVTEEDIQEGRHKKRGIKAICIVGNHLETATARVLKDWVKEGGVIAGYAGGGFLNEHNQPMDILNEVYGVKNQKLEKHDRVIMTKQQLPRLKPIDEITFDPKDKKVKCPAIAFKQSYTPAPGVEIEATYKDGSPAVLRHEYGKGVSMLYGSFVCSAYMRDAIPLRPWDRSTAPDGFNQFLPQDFDGELVDHITAPAGWSECRYYVVTDKPLVETCVLDGPNGVAVAVINWLPEPQDLLLTIQFVPRGWDKVRSIRKGPLQSLRRNVVIDVKLRVDVADMILIEK